MTADDIATNAETTGESQQINCDLRARPTVFVEICYFLPVAAVVLLCMPLPTDHFRPIVAALLLAIAVAVGVVGRLRRRRTVSLRDDGIVTRRGLVEWRHITRIDVESIRALPIMLRLGHPRQRRLALPGSLPVLRKVVPAILAHRPDLEVSDRLRRLLDAPERAVGTRLWAVALSAIVPVVLAVMPLVVRHYGGHGVLGATLAAMAFLAICSLGRPGSLDAEKSFVNRVPLGSVLSLLFLALWTGSVWLYMLDAVFALCAVLTLAACIVGWPGVRLTPLLKAAILLAALGVPTAVYALADRTGWPRTHITGLTGKAVPFPAFLWSDDGRLAAATVYVNGYEERHYVLDVAEPRATRLPIGRGTAIVGWLDRSRVVWRVSEQDLCSLHLYTFADGRDRILATSPELVLSRDRCVSPDRRRLCWLESKEKGPKATVKLYELATGETRDIPVTLPDRKGVEVSDCRWVDDDGLAVVAFERESDDSGDRPRSVHLLRLDVMSETSTLTSVGRKLQSWRVSPDCRFAFAATADDEPQLVDLHSGTVTPFGGTALPHWTRDGRYAFRVERDGDGRRWLSRYQGATGAEERLLRIPRQMAVENVSPRGRFAALRSGRSMPPRLTIVNLATMERKHLNVRVESFIDFNSAFSTFPGLSAWSPDERRFAVRSVSSMSFSPPGPRSLVYTVPDDWAGPPPATMPAATRPRP